MNILLWVVQIAVALLFLVGGGYKTFNPDVVAKRATTLPPGGWRAVGVFEVLGAVLLIVPAAVSRMPILTPLAATGLALESPALAALYARRSRRLVAANPLVYAVPMALLAAFVAYGRFALSPLG